MSRKVNISKVEGATIVEITNVSNGTPNITSYDVPYDFRIVANQIIVYGEFPILAFTFPELDNNLGAANLEEYFEKMTENKFFTTDHSDPDVSGFVKKDENNEVTEDFDVHRKGVLDPYIKLDDQITPKWGNYASEVALSPQGRLLLKNKVGNPGSELSFQAGGNTMIATIDINKGTFSSISENDEDNSRVVLPITSNDDDYLKDGSVLVISINGAYADGRGNIVLALMQIGGDLGGTLEAPTVQKLSAVAETGKTIIPTVLDDGTLQGEEVFESWVYDDTLTGYSLSELQTEYPTSARRLQGFEVRCRLMTPPTTYRKESVNDSQWVKIELEDVT